VIVIVDYGSGNLKSVQNMFNRLAHPALISGEPQVIASASRLILPGVGHFRYAMDRLRESSLLDVLTRRVLKDKIPILGICLGAQLLGKHSEEGNVPGLGWLPMRTRAFDLAKLNSRQTVPHMGWTETHLKEESRLAYGIERPARFYYVHSYHFECETTDIELSRAVYGYEFVSGVELENIRGVQFHPEKSHRFGMKILQNFVERA
jgi:glutamine amidotransferase